MAPDEHLNITEIAQRLGVSRWTASRVIHASELEPAGGRGGSQITRSAYTAWVNSQAVSPGTEDGAMPTDLPDLIPLANVAERYGLSLRGLKEGARARKFAHTRIGRERYFTTPQLTAFLAAREVQPAEAEKFTGMRQRRERRTQKAAA